MPTPAYAAITLGSNSFNMLIAKTKGGQPQIIAKYKRKVRLAEGIGEDGHLTAEVMQRGLDCLAMFAQMLALHKIHPNHVAVIATATLRCIHNADEFNQKAIPLLGHPIEIISGMREAELIYQGMVATTCGQGRRLVIDIGGASTEFIIGDGHQVQFKTSLPMGSVTFNRRFFNNAPLQELDFDDAKQEVLAVLGEHRQRLKDLGWHCVVGASGAVQSVVEVLMHRKQSEIITLAVLTQLKAEILAEEDVSLEGIIGLSAERAPTFAAGVAILLALFELLGIEQLALSGGALREGVLVMLAQRILEEAI
ncbi:exopolyphosphatase [Shewanella sp. LC6]|jgi:exopolyphosphatase/guanosine-5'-triphosphate,3'-diphosphate pyrophosphatase|uniref:Ppx/GppA phosphatase family protein n=1 Tax=unclassified Shewanella TaxID=196818 RepID=UPI00112D9A23|nr:MULTISPECIES: exopolyphosphatase [unclassified Shewanella]QQK61736.1 exopolyphosphatase [Shewanella sp. LC6]TPE57237.1 exopolyphosphatase [Shewanella sp. LC2]